MDHGLISIVDLVIYLFFFPKKINRCSKKNWLLPKNNSVINQKNLVATVVLVTTMFKVTKSHDF